MEAANGPVHKLLDHPNEVRDYARNTLQYSYLERIAYGEEAVRDAEAKEQICRGPHAAAHALKELVILIYDVIKLIFFAAPIALFTWDSDYLCAHAFEIARDGEAFLGQFLLALHVHEGMSFLGDADLHRMAYKEFLDNQANPGV